jgi:hypothetical protein
MPTRAPTAIPTPTLVPGITGITLSPGMTIGDYGKVIPVSQAQKPITTGVLGKLPPNQTGGPGIMLSPGTTLGPYGKVIPVSQVPTPLPAGPNNTASPLGPGGQGIVLSPGMTLGPYSSIIPANRTIVTPVPRIGG